MPKKQVVNITVCGDPATLGNYAIEQDVYAYANNLAKLVEHEFGCVVHIHLDSDANSTADNQSVRERIREIESTDEWRKLLP